MIGIRPIGVGVSDRVGSGDGANVPKSFHMQASVDVRVSGVLHSDVHFAQITLINALRYVSKCASLTQPIVNPRLPPVARCGVRLA